MLRAHLPRPAKGYARRRFLSTGLRPGDTLFARMALGWHPCPIPSPNWSDQHQTEISLGTGYTILPERPEVSETLGGGD